jgi:K+-transporting ATPase KdpF subunit
MQALDVIGGLLAAALLLYLFYALLKPEALQ